MTPQCLNCAKKVLGKSLDLVHNWGMCWICHVEFNYYMTKPEIKDVDKKTCVYYDTTSDGRYVFYGDENMSYWAIEGVKGNKWSEIHPSSPNIKFDIVSWPFIDEKDFIYSNKDRINEDL